MKEQYFKKGSEFIPPGGFPEDKNSTIENIQKAASNNFSWFSKVIAERKAKKLETKEKMKELYAETMVTQKVTKDGQVEIPFKNLN